MAIDVATFQKELDALDELSTAMFYGQVVFATQMRGMSVAERLTMSDSIRMGSKDTYLKKFCLVGIYATANDQEAIMKLLREVPGRMQELKQMEASLKRT